MKIKKGLAVERWPEGRFLRKGRIEKVLEEDNQQFFISSSSYDASILFMGIICSENNKLFSLIAKDVKKKINYEPIIRLPCFGLELATVTAEDGEYIAFLINTSDVGKDFSDRSFIFGKENRKAEERLLEAIEAFNVAKEIIRKECLTCFSGE